MLRIHLITYRGKRTQKEMAARYGVSQQAWSKWEKGECTPSLPIMKQIEIDSGIPMEEMFPDAFNFKFALVGR